MRHPDGVNPFIFDRCTSLSPNRPSFPSFSPPIREAFVFQGVSFRIFVSKNEISGDCFLKCGNFMAVCAQSGRMAVLLRPSSCGCRRITRSVQSPKSGGHNRPHRDERCDGRNRSARDRCRCSARSIRPRPHRRCASDAERSRADRNAACRRCPCVPPTPTAVSIASFQARGVLAIRAGAPEPPPGFRRASIAGKRAATWALFIPLANSGA